MMTKKRTGGSASLKMIMAIPLAMVMVLMFSCNDRSEAQKNADAGDRKGSTRRCRVCGPRRGIYGC
ncbi:MAG: hypothetical protein U5L72_19335 [Bacteroidales bacterium]|nr:hypothetical protein [Bacteroidales bacterium]